MDKVGIHGAASTKSMAIMGGMLKVDDFIKLAGMESLDEFENYLMKNTCYSPEFNDLNEKNKNIEYLIKSHMYKNYEKLYHFYIDEYRFFFKSLLMRYEVENIKLMLRAIARNEDVQNIKDRLVYSEVFSTIDYDGLSEASDIKEFVGRLKNTGYYSQLINYVDENPSKILFYMEMVLDRLYFRQLYDSICNLEKNDKKMTLELYGINVDLLNIQWIYRGRKFFGISSEELFNFTLNNGLKYNYRLLKDLCYMDLDKFKSLVMSMEYKSMFQDEEYLMERAMERYLFENLDVYLKKSRMSIIIPIVMIFKSEYEMRDLITIIECIRYKVANIEDFLVRRFERSE
ncbi:V/A-type H+-transporting ATPase subunit C [Dethiosulfatibacter aminovorans DSM 17477]|uniref:V/A-type H+-transporting ATPase subunit C n=1 Tax=Dethiosulfatibacter aminovorans DSM 17477 TaxID=1121476 RepID=A0A1M6IA28_9FIRM|nr:V-type ATPase subunit [Dethiosulfatibacter aminovorans]SHJ31303.1 V/A-type H+-transporting ATPase subunit C [Dethiosulfatibacter aminovorans DSM 17477]